MTLDVMASDVPFEMVAVKDTTLEAWNAVNTMQIGSVSVRKTNGQCLRRECESIRFKDGESMDDFMIWL